MLLIELNKEDITIKLQELKGIYFVYMLYDGGNLFYIGCSKNIYKRMKDHLYRRKQFDCFELIQYPDELRAKIAEKKLILKYKPELNKHCKYIERSIITKNMQSSKNDVSIQRLKQVHAILNR
jgi:excinuclease UvrABC nuclease subunit